jgi:flagellar biogenesis protein FliO
MDAVRQILAVVLVFALLGVLLWAVRRTGGTLSLRHALRFTRSAGRVRALQSVERLALTPQHSLHVVRWNGREMMVATHPQGCSVLNAGAPKADA